MILLYIVCNLGVVDSCIVCFIDNYVYIKLGSGVIIVWINDIK